MLERPPATRVAVPAEDDPAGELLVEDAVYGPVHEVLARDCGDFLLRRSDGVVAYQLAVVVDDGEMGVTQVVRGRDLLGSAARQTWLAHELGYRPPRYGHVPLLVAPDGRRLSKRDRDLDLGAIREHERGPKRLLGMLAAAVGLAEEGEEVSSDTLVGRFSWGTIAVHRDDIVVSGNFA